MRGQTSRSRERSGGLQERPFLAAQYSVVPMGLIWRLDHRACSYRSRAALSTEGVTPPDLGGLQLVQGKKARLLYPFVFTGLF